MDNDLQRLEQKLDAIIDHFHIGKEKPKMTDNEITKYAENIILKFEDRRKRKEAGHGSEGGQTERQGHCREV